MPALEHIGALFEGLVLAEPRPYRLRARFAQEAVRELLAAAGDPQLGLPIIHIAGSKGKGSTALLAEAILEAGGLRTGTFTSPHLERWTERFRVGGHEVTADTLLEILQRLRPHIDRSRAQRPDNPPSFFDVATAASLLLFREAAVDVAIIETGIGGSSDATNVVNPSVTCVTSIELEHTDKLGTTLEAIAAEKAGIVKAGVPVIVGALSDAALGVVTAHARNVGAPVIRLGDAINLEAKSRHTQTQALRVWINGRRLDANLPFPGRHLAQNAALAVACVERLNVFSSERLEVAVAIGLSSVRLPARSEIASRAPWVVIDGAHTAGSVRALVEVLATLPARNLHVLLSVTRGKQVTEAFAALLAAADALTLTQADPQRSTDVTELECAVRGLCPSLPAELVPDPISALDRAFARLPRDGLLCVSGSMYMAGIGRAWNVRRSRSSA